MWGGEKIRKNKNKKKGVIESEVGEERGERLGKNKGG